MRALTILQIIGVFVASLFLTVAVADTTGNSTMATSSAEATTSDADIVANVQTKISQDTSLVGANISVSSQQGLVTLSGSVNNSAQVVTAISDAKTVAGVKDIKLDLTIKSSENSGISSF
jgi:hyperosmotically inducible protein